MGRFRQGNGHQGDGRWVQPGLKKRAAQRSIWSKMAGRRAETHLCIAIPLGRLDEERVHFHEDFVARLCCLAALMPQTKWLCSSKAGKQESGAH